MAQGQLPIDLLINQLSCTQLSMSQASITDAMVVAAAGVQASKLQHQYTHAYSQPAANSAAVERKVTHVVRGATATILDFKVGATTAALTGATATFDLWKNGVSVLTGTITLDQNTAAYALKAGTFASTSSVAGDVWEIVVSAVAAGGGTLAKGLFAYLTLREDAQ